MICLVPGDKHIEKLFLKLPSLLYSKNNPQSLSDERRILKGTHPLSKDMKVFPFVVTDEFKKPISRILLTVYDNDDTGYLGFFESANNNASVRLLFNTVECFAKKLGIKNLLGPVNCSIYLGYRFKTNRFEDCFTGEPYNLPYYAKLWESNGYSVCNNFYSYRVDRVSPEESDTQLGKILKRFKAKGYDFCTMQGKNFDICMEQIYRLLNKRYSEFVAFKPITYGQFKPMFRSLKYVLDFDMVKLAYKDGELKAFCVCVPNYGDILFGKLTLSKILKLFKIKKCPTEYIIMYLGADDKCIGLGSAIVHYAGMSFIEKQCTAIAALIKEDSVSSKYYQTKHIDSYNYVLYQKNSV